ncbi:MAG TPA: carboxypeptidase-like regulatory domain-containing protein, partial [Candidatus Baltobacteraceae bacterium]
MNFKATIYALLALGALAACSGGGGGGGALPSVATGGGSGSVGPILPSTAPTGLPGTQPSPQNSPVPGSSPSPNPGSSPTPAPVGTPLPGATPTPVPTGYYASGSVRDADSGAAIAGAVVVIEPQVVPGSTPPPNPTASATTAADGSFTVTSLLPGSNYLEIFESGYATMHEKFNITSFNTQVGNVSLTRLTAEQAAWLQQANADRATYGASPLVFDE